MSCITRTENHLSDPKANGGCPLWLRTTKDASDPRRDVKGSVDYLRTCLLLCPAEAYRSLPVITRISLDTGSLRTPIVLGIIRVSLLHHRA